MSQTIVIADDDQAFLQALKIRLTDSGFEVIATQDAYCAVDAARRHKPDLMILDVNMPAGKGMSVQERIQDIPEIADTPIIYLTGERSAEVELQARKLGAFAVLHKPVNSTELVATIHDAMATHEARKSA